MSPIYISIDQEGTGRNIRSLMQKRHLAVRDIQTACGFERPQAVYKWLHGMSIPSTDNLLVLSRLFHTSMEDILEVSGDALPFYLVGFHRTPATYPATVNTYHCGKKPLPAFVFAALHFFI